MSVGNQSIGIKKGQADELNPTGMLIMFCGDTAPGGWLLCQGQAVSRLQYPELFRTIGTKFGNGDATTTFNLPDLRGRSPIGAGVGTGGGSSGSGVPTGGTALTVRTIGDWDGEETHLLTDTESGLPSHSHTYNNPSAAGTGTSSGAARNATANTGTAGGTNAASAHNTVHPVLTVNFIIKV